MTSFSRHRVNGWNIIERRGRGRVGGREGEKRVAMLEALQVEGKKPDSLCRRCCWMSSRWFHKLLGWNDYHDSFFQIVSMGFSFENAITWAAGCGSMHTWKKKCIMRRGGGGRWDSSGFFWRQGEEGGFILYIISIFFLSSFSSDHFVISSCFIRFFVSFFLCFPVVGLKKFPKIPQKFPKNAPKIPPTKIRGWDGCGLLDAARRTFPCRRCYSNQRLESWTCRRWPGCSPGTGPQRRRPRRPLPPR